MGEGMAEALREGIERMRRAVTKHGRYAKEALTNGPLTQKPNHHCGERNEHDQRQRSEDRGTSTGKKMAHFSGIMNS
jgi:hypothetical protein